MKFFVMLFITFFFLNISFVSASEPPSVIPMVYWGYVSIDNTPASDGTQITVEVEGNQISSTYVPSGYTSGSSYYHVYVPSEYAGKTAVFKVNAIPAYSVTLNVLGSINRIDLSISTTTPPPSSIPPSGGGMPVTSGFTKKMTFSGDFGIEEITILAKTGISNTITTAKEVQKPSGIQHAISSVNGAVYKYIEITTDVKNSDINKVMIKFKVPKTWINDNTVDENKLALKKYKNNEWVELKTQLLNKDEEYIYYSSENYDFSIFAITGDNFKSENCTPGLKRCLGNELQECNTNNSWIILESCNHGCDSKTLSCKLAPICTSGEEKCLDNDLQECMNGEWSTKETCYYGCSEGKCNTAISSTGYITQNLTSYIWIIIIIIVILIAILYYKKR